MERFALILIAVLAPHTKFPATGLIYSFRPVDFVLILAAVVFVRFSRRLSDRSVAGSAMLLAFAVAIASALWGGYNLKITNLDYLMDSGALVPYWYFAIKKLLLLVVCFAGFRFILTTQAISNSTLLKFWHRGLVISVLLHAFCYLITSDFFAVRAGVFVEGNHAGSYYLLSFFMMWFAQQQGYRFGFSGMIYAFAGVLLSQSTTSIVLLVLLVTFAFLTILRSSLKHTLRMRNIVVFIFATSVLISFFGNEVETKLLGEDINYSSFSRYDRLASISSGINMFLDYPIFGMGIQSYAFALPMYVDPFIDSFFDWNSRRIANNIYVEWLAEQGIIGFFVMSFVIYRVCQPIFRCVLQRPVLSAGAASILLSWLAFPTYTVSFHWISLAILVRLAVLHENNERPALCGVISKTPLQGEASRPNAI